MHVYCAVVSFLRQGAHNTYTRAMSRTLISQLRLVWVWVRATIIGITDNDVKSYE